MNKFVELLTKPKDVFISTRRLYLLFCSLYNKDLNSYSIKKFFQELQREVLKKYSIKLKKEKKRVGHRSIRGLVGIDVPLLTEQNFLEKLLKENKETTQKLFSISSGTVDNKKPKTVRSVDTKKRIPNMDTDVSISDFVKGYQQGTEKDFISTADLYNSYIEFYKDQPLYLKYIPSKYHIKHKFVKAWKEVYPDHEIKTNARDPINKTARGIANIKLVV